MSKNHIGKTDEIREYVLRTRLEPARRRGQTTVRVVAGEVHRDLALRNRVPMVCNALRSKELLSAAGARIVGEEGPQSGQSTTVAITYELLPQKGEGVPRKDARIDTFQKLRGVAKEVFKSLGGGEQFIRKERERFFNEKHK